jgi:hypothetical protein
MQLPESDVLLPRQQTESRKRAVPSTKVSSTHHVILLKPRNVNGITGGNGGGGAGQLCSQSTQLHAVDWAWNNSID